MQDDNSFSPFQAAVTESPKSDGTLLTHNFEAGMGSWSITQSVGGIAEIAAHTGGVWLRLRSESTSDGAYACSAVFTNPHETYVAEFDYYKPAESVAKDWHIYGSRGGGVGDWRDIVIVNTGDALTVHHGGGVQTLGYKMPANQWMHFAIDKLSEDTIRLYINGKLHGAYLPIANKANMIAVGPIGAPLGSVATGEGYWDHFSIGPLISGLSNEVYSEDFECSTLANWSVETLGDGIVEAVKMRNTHTLHVKSLDQSGKAAAKSPYFAIGDVRYSCEFDYYKPSGVMAKSWQIYGSLNGDAGWNGIRIVQSDDSSEGELTVYYGDGLAVTIPGVLAADHWTHFIISNNGSGGIELYIDGKYKGTFALLSTNAGSTTNFGWLGVLSGSGAIGEGYWDNFRAATTTNVVTIYTTSAYSEEGARTVQITTPGSSLEFTSFGSGYAAESTYPGFTEASTIRSISLMDTHGDYHVGGLRWAGQANGGTLHCHHPYALDVLKINSKIAVFQATTQTEWNPFQGKSTYYIFQDLPEVIFIDTELERVIDLTALNGNTSIYVYSYQFYAKGTNDGSPKYNGIRLWFEDPNPPGIPWFSGTGVSGNELCKPDGMDGVFLYYERLSKADFHGLYWAPQKLTKGMGVQQADCKNSWSSNPPVGYIFDKNKSWGHFGNANEEYYGIVPCIEFDPVREYGHKSSSSLLLFFARETGNLTGTKSIYNLEESFRFQLHHEPLQLTTTTRPVVTVTERNNKFRYWQIVVMTAAYAELIPSASLRGNIYLGKPKLVALLKDVVPGSSFTLGELPIVLYRNSDTSFIVESRCVDTIRDVTITIPVQAGQTVKSVLHGGESILDFEQDGAELSYIHDIESEESQIFLTYLSL